MSRLAVGRCSNELKSKQPRLSVRIALWLLSDLYVVWAIGLAIIYCIFGG